MKVIIVISRAIDSAVYKVAQTLYDNDYDVTLLVWDRTKNLEKNEKEYNIHRFKLKAPHDKWNVIFYLPLWWLYEFFYLLRTDADIIHVCDLDTLWPAILVKFLKRKKLFYTIYDFYASNFQEFNPKFISKTVIKLFSNIEKLGIKFTDTLFLTGEHRFNEVKGAQIKNLRYIYNSPPDLFESKIKSKDDNILIFYGGMIDKVKGLEYMVEAVKSLDDVKMKIAGEGPYLKELKKIINNNDKFEFLGWLSYDEILKNTLEADILFVFNDPSISRSVYGSPNKLFEAMMATKPIILNSEMLISKIVEKEKCGITVPYGDIDEIKNAINVLSNNEIRRELGENGRNSYINKYSWYIMEKRILNEYNSVEN